MAQIVSPVPDRLEQLLNAPDGTSPAGGSSTPVDRATAPHFVPMVPVAEHPAASREIAMATPSAAGGSAADRDGASPHAAPPVLPLPPSVPSPGDTTTRDEPVAPGKPAAPIETPSTTGPQTGGQSGVTAMAAEPPNGVGPLASEAAGRVVVKARADSWVEVRDPESNATLMARLLRRCLSNSRQARTEAVDGQRRRVGRDGRRPGRAASRQGWHRSARHRTRPRVLAQGNGRSRPALDRNACCGRWAPRRGLGDWTCAACR